MTIKGPIIVTDYSEKWPEVFRELSTVYTKALGSLIVDIQHVGSTAVPGLAANPVIDIDIIAASRRSTEELIRRLEPMGYGHLGEIGITDRQAFRRLSDEAPIDGSQRTWPAHNLYVCLQGSASLRNHLALRDYLRTHEDEVLAYGNLKKKLAAQYPHDIDAYIRDKAPYIITILRKLDFSDEELTDICQANGL